MPRIWKRPWERVFFGLPFYITEGDERFWGQDRIADLDAHLSGTL